MTPCLMNLEMYRPSSQILFLRSLGKILEILKLNKRCFLYFKNSKIFPKLRRNNIQLDGRYISKFIKQGVIRNQIDLQMITEHLEKDVITQALKLIQKQNFASSIQLQHTLEKQGLNYTCVDRLLYLSLQNQNKKCISLCLSELISKQLCCYIRQKIQTSTKKNIFQIVYQQLRSWLNEEKYIIQIIRGKLQKYNSCINFNLLGHFSHQYVLTSVLESLGLNIEIKRCPDVERIEAEDFCFWKEMQFTSENFSLNFTPKIAHYSYQAFQKDYEILNNNLFISQKIVISETFNKDVLLSLINRKQSPYYWQSEFYRLMSTHQKIKVNQYLAHFLPYDLKQSYAMSNPQQLYYCLKNNSTGYILTKEHFNICLLAIKWLIKFQNNLEATIKLDQQLLRVLIWCKSHSRLIIDLYDLKTQYAELIRKEEQSLKSGLLALQTAINYFKNSEDECIMIVIRCLRLADNHFKQSKFTSALSLYKIASELIQKVDDKEIQELEIEQLIQIHNREVKIEMALCRIDEALQTCSSNFKHFQRYLSIFRQKKDILQKIIMEQFYGYLLQLRCYQVLGDYQSVLKLIAEISKKFIEEDILNCIQNQAMHSFSEFAKKRFIQAVKYLWIAVICNSEQFKYITEDSQSAVIDLGKITEYAEFVKKQNRGLYRYSILEVYKHIVGITENLTSNERIQDSILLTLVVRNFEALSKGSIKLARSKIYDESSKADQVLFLECLLQVMGYQFAIATLKQAQNEYIF